jgi:hypothetical protein
MFDLIIFFQGNSTTSLKNFCLFDFASIDWICHITSFTDIFIFLFEQKYK